MRDADFSILSCQFQSPSLPNVCRRLLRTAYEIGYFPFNAAPIFPAILFMLIFTAFC